MNQNIQKGTALNVLSLEDSERDFEIICALLNDSGFDVQSERVDTEKDFTTKLHTGTYDIILADFKLPGFNAFKALEIACKISPVTPFICISGTIGEETAVELIKCGAVDYILKDKPNRLPVAVQRALDEAVEKKKRKEAEDKLRQSQHNLTEAERIGKVGGWEFNIDTGKQIWTEEVYEIHEVDLTFEPTVENGIQFYSPASRPIIEAAVKKSVEDGAPFDVELEIITAKGNLCSVHVIGNVDLEHRRVFGFFQDITERKRAERELKKSEARFRHISSTISDISYSCKVDQGDSYSIDWMTGAAERITGYTIDEIKAKRCWGKLVVDEDAGLFKEFVTGLVPGSSGSCELRLKHKSGNIVWVTSVAECVHDQEISESHILYGGLVDITERKRSEEDILQSREYFKNVFEHAAVGKSITSLDGTLRTNRAFSEMLGYSEEEFVNIHWMTITHPDDVEKNQQVIKSILSGEKLMDRWEKRYIHKDRNIVFADITTTLQRDTNGKPLYFITTIQDITERKLAEKALQYKMDELQKFQHLTVGRELTMIELKKEVNALLKKSGGKEKYKIIA